jgi:hypothetical protein
MATNVGGGGATFGSFFGGDGFNEGVMVVVIIWMKMM